MLKSVTEKGLPFERIETTGVASCAVRPHQPILKPCWLVEVGGKEGGRDARLEPGRRLRSFRDGCNIFFALRGVRVSCVCTVSQGYDEHETVFRLDHALHETLLKRERHPASGKAQLLCRQHDALAETSPAHCLSEGVGASASRR